jgi:hypothetical protein
MHISSMVFIIMYKAFSARGRDLVIFQGSAMMELLSVIGVRPPFHDIVLPYHHGLILEFVVCLREGGWVN